MISANKTFRGVHVHEHFAFEQMLVLIRPKEWSWKRKKAMLST